MLSYPYDTRGPKTGHFFSKGKLEAAPPKAMERLPFVLAFVESLIFVSARLVKKSGYLNFACTFMSPPQPAVAAPQSAEGQRKDRLSHLTHQVQGK